MFFTRVARVCFVCLMLCKEESSSPVSLQLLRGGSVSLLGVVIGTMLANFHV